MILYDTFTLDGVRRTGDGYVAAFARVARTGIQEYKGSELGRPDLDVVRVYRPPDEVFNADALKSFAHRPVTLTHPKVPVTAKNWKKYAGGQTGDEVVRDGEYVRVPMVMMDQKLIDAYELDGVKELSMGYSTDIKWRTGIVDAGQPDAGQSYDAVQTAIRGNHLAVVPLARGGDQLRIGDGDFRSLVAKINDMDDDEDEDDNTNVGDAWSDEARAAALEARKNASQHYVSAHQSRDNADQARSSGDKDAFTRHTNAAKYHLRAGEHFDEAAKHYDAGRKVDGDRKSVQAYKTLRKLNDSSPTNDAETKDCPNCGAEIPTGAKDCPECHQHLKDGDITMRIITVDGLNVSVADDQGASIIERHIANLTRQVADAKSGYDKIKNEGEDKDKDLDDAKKVISTRDGEIAVLKKQVDDAKITPAKLDQLVKDRLAVIDAAVTVLDKTFAFDGKSVEEIKRATVDAYLGDAAKGMDDTAVAGAFIAATAVKDGKRGGSQPIRDALRVSGNHRPGNVNDARETAYDEKTKKLSDAWRKPTAAA